MAPRSRRTYRCCRLREQGGVTIWAERPVEQRTMLNPAFLAVLVHETARGHAEEGAGPLSFALPFLALPMVLHAPTRESLPTIATSMVAWLQDHPPARVAIAPLAIQLVDPTREAIRLGVRCNALTFDERGNLKATGLRQAGRGSATVDMRRCRDRAHFVGRWFARTGDTGTTLSAWGLQV